MNSLSSHNISRRESSLVTAIIQGSGLLTVKIYVCCVYVGLRSAGFLLRPGLLHKRQSLFLCGLSKQKTVPATFHKLPVNYTAFFPRNFNLASYILSFIFLMSTEKKNNSLSSYTGLGTFKNQYIVHHIQILFSRFYYLEYSESNFTFKLNNNAYNPLRIYYSYSIIHYI